MHMKNELLIAVLAGLGGMLGWGFADFFAKKTIDVIGDVVSLAWGHIFGTIVLFIALLYQFGVRGGNIALPSSTKAWGFLVCFGIGQALVYLFLYSGFGKGQVGVLSPVFASFSGLTAILSIAIFSEPVTGYIALGLFVLFTGILLINANLDALKAKRFSFTRVPGFKEVALATLMAGFWTLFWARFVGGNDWLSYAFFMYAFMTLAILIIAKLQRVKLRVTESSSWKYLILIGICETGAYLAISIGYSLTPRTSVVALLSGAFSLPTIILARLFLKERITALQTVGSLIIIIGIAILAWVR